ncbi:phenylalanine--tRNA ligase subunit beta [Candidatus Woesearchaeota archaeon]|nr:phenylalanine--tRNA ligase subunit beta [Candidatus Woesearchaeota archaeon]
MPTVTLNKEVFEKMVGKKLPLEELKDRISMLGTDLEKIEGNDIVVEVFPNRPDMLSEAGFARAFSSFIKQKTGLRTYKTKKSGFKVLVDKSVTMRPYTACAIIKNLKFDDERIRQVMQIQEKLAKTHGRNRKKSAYGLYPSKAISFPLSYVAKDSQKVMFQPLGFDKKIVASQVEELHPKGKEYKSVAKGWKKYPFFIDAKENVLCMLPYTNSHDTGKIDERTTDVFVECTGNDFENVSFALNILATMLADMGGEIYTIDIVYPDKTVTMPNLEPKKMMFDVSYINKYLGLQLSDKECVAYLERMGYGYEKGHVLVPAYRVDILHPIDLVEDIAIAYGYENFAEEIPNVMTIARQNPFEVYKKKVAEMMVGLGFLETKSYHIMSKENQTARMNIQVDVIELANSVSVEHHSMRAWMLPSMMQILTINTHHEYPQRIFEMGTTFRKNAKMETNVEEGDILCTVSCHAGANVTEAKQMLDYLMRMLGMQYEVHAADNGCCIPGRCGKVMVGGKEVGFFGELHPQVLANWNLEMPACFFEVDVSALFGLRKISVVSY